MQQLVQMTPILGSVATWMHPESGGVAKGVSVVAGIASVVPLASEFAELGSSATELGSLSTEVDVELEQGAQGASFWTGGDPARIAAEQYGLTLGQTPLGQAATEASDAMLDAGVLWDVVKQLVWEPASKAFAESASGIPVAFINKINPATVWSQVEFSALMYNPEVEQIWIKYISEVSSLTDEEEWFRMGDAWVDSGQFFLPPKP
jgi:hypothetical protein